MTGFTFWIDGLEKSENFAALAHRPVAFIACNLCMGIFQPEARVPIMIELQVLPARVVVAVLTLFNGLHTAELAIMWIFMAVFALHGNGLEKNSFHYGAAVDGEVALLAGDFNMLATQGEACAFVVKIGLCPGLRIVTANTPLPGNLPGELAFMHVCMTILATVRFKNKLPKGFAVRAMHKLMACGTGDRQMCPG